MPFISFSDDYETLTQDGLQKMCVSVCDPVHLIFCRFLLFVCEACKARCAHPAWVRYRAIKIHLLLLKAKIRH